MSEAQAWFCYLLECADHSYYVGVATDVEDRVNTTPGSAPSTLELRKPVRLVWSRACKDHPEARSVEARLKGWSREKKRRLIMGSLRLD